MSTPTGSTPLETDPSTDAGLRLVVDALERAEHRASIEREAMRGEFSRSLESLALRIDVAVGGVRIDLRSAVRGVILSNVIAMMVIAALAGVTSYLRLGATTFGASPTAAAETETTATASAAPE